MSEACMVYVTAASEQEGETLARGVVEAQLAACANLLPRMRSFYWWEGKLQSDQEVVVIFKTLRSLVPRLTDKVKSTHSYSCPCIVELPITGGNRDFLQWIAEACAAELDSAN